ncbi:Netrin receptor UNC5B-b%2C partial [Xyrichtys novacula]|uniref:Netrin receptor UNC5B-b, partial n=1 Tax=Xyrichtys novacula TaxID=13765 RepID=A0AAV1G352_XYRNO|nr:Netrin receptor UNC5B-b%2C partial [Xyrichtys novacula]
MCCSMAAASPPNRNLSCSDKVPLTGGSGFSSRRAAPGLPWGISSMPPVETPSDAQPIPYSNDATHCALIGCEEAEVSSAKVQDRAAWALCGVWRVAGGGVMWA